MESLLVDLEPRLMPRGEDGLIELPGFATRAGARQRVTIRISLDAASVVYALLDLALHEAMDEGWRPQSMQ